MYRAVASKSAIDSLLAVIPSRAAYLLNLISRAAYRTGARGAGPRAELAVAGNMALRSGIVRRAVDSCDAASPTPGVKP
jgi:hypothetical protein